MADGEKGLSAEHLRQLRSLLAERGWYLTDHYLGGGGGGVAYLCVKNEVLERANRHLNMLLPEPDLTSGVIGRSTKPLPDPRMKKDHLLRLSEGLAELGQRRSPPLAVLKYARNDDWRFQREIKVLQRCQHPNLVKIFEADPAEKPRWYVMEFIAGGSLDSKAKEYGGKGREVLTQLRDLTDAVCVLHENGFIHRDIKPENIFVREDGSWVLADPGIAFDKEGTEKTEMFAPRTKDWHAPWAKDRTFEAYPQEIDLVLLGRVAYWALNGQDRNPNPSQLTDSDFYLQNMAKGEHLSKIHGFITTFVTEKREAMKLKSAQELRVEAGKLLTLFDQRLHQVQLISHLAILPESFVAWNESIYRLKKIHLMFPDDTVEVFGSVRLYVKDNSFRNNFGANLSNAVNGAVVSTVGGEFEAKRIHEPNMGTWCEFRFPIKEPMSGSHFFTITQIPNPASVSGLQLWARYRA